MSMKIEWEFLCYEVIRNSDLTEGRGSSVTIGFCLDSQTAYDMARGKDVMGSDAHVKEVYLPVLIIFDESTEPATPSKYYLLGQELLTLTEKRRQEIKREAKITGLSKLSPAEKEALGLDHL